MCTSSAGPARALVVRSDPPWWSAHAVAVGLTLLSVAVTLVLRQLLGGGFAWLLGYPTVALVAWYGGAGPGLLATALLSLAGAALDGRVQLTTPEALRVAVFVASGVLISGLAESSHRARRALAAVAAEREKAARMLAASQQLAHVGSWELDLGDLEHLDGNALRWSEETFRIFGFEPGAVRVTNDLFFEAVHPDDRPAIRRAVAQALEERAPYEIEHRVRRPDGEEAWVHEWGTIVVDERGRPARMLGTCQDVTGRRRAETALRAREDQLRLIMDAAPVLISYIDAAYRYVMVNAAYERMLHQDAAALQGRHVREVLGDAVWEAVRPKMERALRGETVTYEKELPIPGRPGWYSLAYVPHAAADGAVRGLVVLGVDITDRKLAEATLRRVADQTERLRLLAVGLSEAVTDPQVARVIVERAPPILGAAGGRVGLLADDGAVRTLDVEGPPWPPDAGWCLEAVRAPRPVLGEASATIRLAVGERALGLLELGWGAPRTFSDEDQRVLLLIGGQCAQALDRANLYAREQAARARAEAASRAKDEFLAMLGHELRNPLAPIMTAVQLMKLRGGAASPNERSIIERQAKHLVQLVDDLLDVSRIARGKLALKRAPVDLGAVLAKASEIASPLLEQRRHRLTTDVAPGLRVHADETRLAQVFANLLTNAARYTPPGGHVSVTARREGDELVVAVADDGVGIEPDLLPRIFELFVQGPRGVDRGAGGLGLGLALVRNLVVLHGGSVAAHSPGPGRGSTFVVRLPALRATEPQALAGPPAAPAQARRPLRVLVVDDNRDAADMLVDLLRNAGHEVGAAHDALEALAAIDLSAPDVAIVDIGLPVMDGYELAQRVRAAAPGHGPALIALTGYGQPGDRARAEQAGFVAHLVKPVEAEQLLETLAAAAG